MHGDPLVYLVDRDPAMLESLAWLIESVNLKVKSYKCGEKFLADYTREKHSCSCALLEANMKDMSGHAVQQYLKQKGDPLPIIFISDDVDVSLVVQTMKEGAVDFLIKPFNDSCLLASVTKALAIDKALREKQEKSIKFKEQYALLSQREVQVLNGILASEKNKLMSTKLHISLKTVEAHRASLMKKLQVKSVVELIKLLIEQG